MISCFDIKSLNSETIEKLKCLYREGFPDDSERDIDFCFNGYFSEVVCNDDYTAALYPVLKKALIRGVAIDLPYIVAFSALKRVRGSSVAAEIIKSYIVRLHNEKVAYVALYPFNHEYYRRYGFVTVDSASHAEICNFKRVACDNRIEFAVIMEKVYNAAMSRYDNYLLRSYTECVVACERALADGGETVIFTDSSNDECRNGEENCIASAINGNAVKIYGYSIDVNGAPAERLLCRNNDTKSSAFDNVQMRICNPIEAIRLTNFNLFDNLFVINILLTDSIMGDAIYKLEILNGKGRLTKTQDTPDLRISIEDLTRYLINGSAIEGIPHNLLNAARSYFIDKY